MTKALTLSVAVAAGCLGCTGPVPAPWEGPTLSEPRTQLTVEQLLGDEAPPLLDMSFLARPDWAVGDGAPFVGGLRLRATTLAMSFPEARELYPGEDLFPAVTLEFLSHEGRLLPKERGLVVTDRESDTLWDVIVGTGATWQERDDEDWSRASFPLSLVDRYFNQVRNCVATFVYGDDRVSNAFVQCSQETADAADEQLGDLYALVSAEFAPAKPFDQEALIEEDARAEQSRLPTRPLADWDAEQEIASYFDKALITRASTSVGAVYADGILHVHPPKTRHGPHPYPSAMRHGVYSVTKSLAGALSLFYFAQRYGEDLFEARIADHVPALADRPEWQGVTFSHALNMATGTRGGEEAELLYEPLVLADSAEQAIENIAAFGDTSDAPGQAFRYATTNTFVLSYALQHLVEEREGDGVRYWDLVRADVLVPIGADGLDLLQTRGEDPLIRIPYLGFGARTTLDQAAKIALLIANEGEFEGEQLLHRGRVREALGRTGWEGLRVNDELRYRHSFWSKSVLTGTCTAEVSYMEGHGANHILVMPSGTIVFRFMDENDHDLVPLIRAVERRQSSCGQR